MVAEADKPTLERIRAKVHSIVPSSAQVILFGSRARGDARSDSDWDILILLDKDRITVQDVDDYTYTLREYGWDNDLIISPVLYTQAYHKQFYYIPFFKNVAEDGIEI